MKNAICNFSEIAPLKKVLLQAPGDELLNLTPNTLERLLYDDIPYLKVAKQEHEAIANAFRAEGVEVVYLTDLAAEALDNGGATVRKEFIRQFITEAGVTSPKIVKHCFDYLNSFKDNHDLIKKCIAGIDITELKQLGKISGFYATRDLGRMILRCLKIGAHAVFERDRLAHINHLAGCVEHFVDARGARQQSELFLDQCVHRTSNSFSFWYKRCTGRPITVKKLPSIRSTNRQNAPCMP